MSGTHADTIRALLRWDCPYSDAVDPGMHSGCEFCADREEILAALDALVAEVERQRARADRAEAVVAAARALRDRRAEYDAAMARGERDQAWTIGEDVKPLYASLDAALSAGSVCEAAGRPGCGCSYEPYDTGATTEKRWLCERSET